MNTRKFASEIYWPLNGDISSCCICISVRNKCFLLFPWSILEYIVLKNIFIGNYEEKLFYSNVRAVGRSENLGVQVVTKGLLNEKVFIVFLQIAPLSEPLFGRPWICCGMFNRFDTIFLLYDYDDRSCQGGTANNNNFYPFC